MVRQHLADSCPEARPTRTCVGCRERAAKQHLLRVVAGGEGPGLVLVPDPRGRAPGRGAYLHPSPECLELAFRRRAFPRALRLRGRPDAEALSDFVRQLARPDTTSRREVAGGSPP